MLGKRKYFEKHRESSPNDKNVKRIQHSPFSMTTPTGFYPKAKLVIIEGNIGVGKTTLSRQLSELLNYKVFLEPTSKNPYLEKFYAKPEKYALKLQLWIFEQRLNIYIQAVKHLIETSQGVLLDRSIFSDKVFADVGLSDGNISPEGYAFYMNIRNLALQGLPLPHVTIYLDANPRICQKRILLRGRDCEKGIPISYLQSLSEAYQTFLSEMSDFGSTVQRLDWGYYGDSIKIHDQINDATKVIWDASIQRNFEEFCSNCLSSLEQTLYNRLQSNKIKEILTLSQEMNIEENQNEEKRAFEKEALKSNQAEYISLQPIVSEKNEENCKMNQNWDTKENSFDPTILDNFTQKETTQTASNLAVKIIEN